MGDQSMTTGDTTTTAMVPVAPVGTGSATVTVLAGLLIPLVTIIGLVVLLALHVLGAAAGIGLIAALAGLHGGAAVAQGSK